MDLSEFPEGTVIFKITESWRPDLSDDELYEVTRGHWIIAERGLHRLRFAVGYARGAIRSVYEIESWAPSETMAGRFRFTGSPGLSRLVGTPVPELDGRQSVVNYAGARINVRKV